MKYKVILYTANCTYNASTNDYDRTEVSRRFEFDDYDDFQNFIGYLGDGANGYVKIEFAFEKEED